MQPLNTQPPGEAIGILRFGSLLLLLLIQSNASQFYVITTFSKYPPIKYNSLSFQIIPYELRLYVIYPISCN